jgi:hypothetical protein
VLSDPLEFVVKPTEELTVSLYVLSAAASTLHGVGLQTAYLASGDVTGAASLPAAEKDDSRYFLTDVETADCRICCGSNHRGSRGFDH